MPTINEDRFSAPRPTFKASSNATAIAAITPRQRANATGAPLTETSAEWRARGVRLFSDLLIAAQATVDAGIAAETATVAIEAKLQPVSEKQQDVSTKSIPAYTITIYTTVGSRVEVAETEEITGYRIRTINGDVVVKTKDATLGYPVLETYKKYTSAVYTANNFGDAQRIADRKLFQREDACHAVVANTGGRSIETVVYRNDAMARTFRAPRAAVARNTAKSTSTLGFVGKATQSRVSFSHG